MLTRRDLLFRAARRGPGAGPRGPVVVVVFLRGGADGLSLVPPYASDAYQRARPTLALRPPSDRRAEASRRAIDLDGTFGLHPGLAPLLPLHRAGELGVIHAVGSDDDTRSHFEAQDRMEHGGPGRGSGWLARLLRASGVGASLSAVAVGRRAPEALRGAPSVAVFERAEEHRVAPEDPAFVAALADLHRGDGALGVAGRQALATVERLRRLPARGAGYPDAPLGRRLAELARLLRGGVDVRAACVDMDGWDTHVAQADAFAERARTLGAALASFRADLGATFGRVTVLVVTEFGRRVAENGSAGTDHGRASAMLVLGEGAGRGGVRGRWPGLTEDALEPPGDLAVTTDHRRAIEAALASRWPRIRECFGPS